MVGFLGTGSSQSDAFRVAAVRQGLIETGYVEGRNVTFEYRWAEDHNERLPALAADLVHRGVRVIASIGGLTTAVAAKSSTATIPIVFEIGGDPVGLGLVSSLNRPGGNITGVSLLIGTLSAKRFQIIQETAPKAALIGFLMNPANADAQAQTKDVLAAAQSVGQKLAVIQARTDRELEAAFATLTEKRADALLVMADPFFVTRRDKLVELAADHKVPTIYPLREFVAAGGLMSYGASIAEAHRTVGMYVGRILSGEKPADLPIQQATKVELIINLKTAKALGLEIPMSLIGRADEVIE
ncbi:MAG TPA: ABC transporter substrate-binding protein [Pseudolabrys sp.]|nr:ABC transporter substrate-binding protein [Pseudolabrys sp.]